MTSKISVEAKKSEFMVSNAMDDVTRASRKALMDYLCKMYYVPLAKTIAYLELDDTEADGLLQYLDQDTRTKIIECSKSFAKHEECVLKEVSHIVESSGMCFDDDFQIIKENLFNTEKGFASNAVDRFRSDSPVFKDRLNKCIFDFDDITKLDDRAIQKVLRDLDQQTLAKALKGTNPEVQDKIFHNMSLRASSMLKEDMEFMGPVRAEDVYAARAEVLKIIFHLEETGDIVIYSNPVSELID